MNKYKLYLITDRYDYSLNNFLHIIHEACENGVSLVQLREKEANTRTFYNIALKVKQVTDYHNIPLIINDRVDVCLAVDAAGVHIGDDELPVSITRALIGQDKILGVSADSAERAEEAQKYGADYLGVGAVFSTKTKDDADTISIETLKNITQKVSVPTVAIGGIKEDNIRQLRDTNIQGVSIISEIMKAQDVALKTKNLNKELNKIIKENGYID